MTRQHGTYSSVHAGRPRGFFSTLVAVAILAAAVQVHAADYRMVALAEAPPSDDIAPKIAALLQPTGVKIIKGSSRVLCKIWLCKELAAKTNDQVSAYPLAQGSVVGVVQYERDGGDFRDQEIPEGTYVMRFATIPTDGAHEGVSPTPDFLLLVNAKEDSDDSPIEVETLVEKSADSIESSHPAILALKPPAGDTAPSLVHNEEEDWWLLQLTAKIKGLAAPARLSVVVVGYTEE